MAGLVFETAAGIQFAELGWGFAEGWAGVGPGRAADDRAELHPERQLAGESWLWDQRGAEPLHEPGNADLSVT